MKMKNIIMTFMHLLLVVQALSEFKMQIFPSVSRISINENIYDVFTHTGYSEYLKIVQQQSTKIIMPNIKWGNIKRTIHNIKLLFHR